MGVIASHIGAEDECIKSYNPIKKEIIRVYGTYGEASKHLGLTAKVLRSAALTKTRKFSPILNMEIAIRVSVKTDADREIIKKYNKHSAG